MSGTIALPYRAAPPDAADAPRLAITVVVIAIVLGLAILAVTGSAPLALAPVAATTVAYQLRRFRLTYAVWIVFVAVIVADISPRDIPGSGTMWTSPLYPLMGLLLDNLNSTFGVSALHFSGTEVLLALMLLTLACRQLGAPATRANERLRIPEPLVLAFLVELATILLLELRGIASGGDVRQSLWQFREIVWFPGVVLLLVHASRGARGLALMAYVITFTACLKALIALYYYLRFALPAGYEAPTITSHADTVLFVGVIVIWIAAAIVQPTRSRVLAASGFSVLMLTAIVINNRRTAYVSLAVSLAMIIALLPSRVRHRIARVGLYCLPILVLYVLAGRHHTTGAFAPAGDIVSVVTQQDRSSLTRDIENFNLMVTMRPHTLIGTGWGHEYVEAVKADDISGFFKQYRFIAHNSILWLWSIGGMVGFTGLWLPIPVAVFLTARCRARARTADERAAVYSAFAMYVIFMLQAWADMGVGSWTVIFLLAAAFAVTVRLATTLDAWPASAHLFRPAPRIPAGAWTRRAAGGMAIGRAQRA